MVSVARSLARSWYYFRIGYSAYLAFLLGALNTVVVVWYLAIAQVPSIQKFFGDFVPFAILATLLGIPLSICTGWLHFKRSLAYSSEVEVAVESNPYYYKLSQGGYDRKVLVPTYLEMLFLVKRLLAMHRLLKPEDEYRIADLERKLRILIEGGYLGQPKREVSTL
jgi:hypothetical protein